MLFILTSSPALLLKALSCQVEAFVVLYARCNDIGGLLCNKDYGLYSLQYLTREEAQPLESSHREHQTATKLAYGASTYHTWPRQVLTVRKRLGRTRTWDITRAGEECLVPRVENPGDFNAAGRCERL